MLFNAPVGLTQSQRPQMSEAEFRLRLQEAIEKIKAMAGAPAPATLNVMLMTGIPIDLNGDHKTDWSVVRADEFGSLTWHTLINEGTYSWTQFGITRCTSADQVDCDHIVSADYDGDGRTDLAVWRPSNTPGQTAFYVRRSSDGQDVIQQFGAPGDDPSVIGDYDGDGKVDFAVYRPSTAHWLVRLSSNGQLVDTPWGVPGDVPSSGDFDGDGRCDLVVKRGNAGQATFHILASASGYMSINWGTPGDVIVPGDYDGDGKTDLAVVRGEASLVTWFVRKSSDESLWAVQFGLTDDVLTPGDFDGDGKTDIGVWREGIGENAASHFHVLKSQSSTYHSQEWGLAGDYPPANLVASDETMDDAVLIRIDQPPNNSARNQPFQITGVAIDRHAPSGSGVDVVHVYAVPNGSGPAQFVGSAQYGAPRTDIAAEFGSQFLNSGYSFSVSGLAQGPYLFLVVAHSTVTTQFEFDDAFGHVVYVDMPPKTLTVSVSGPGIVTSVPAGIACGSGQTACSAIFDHGTTVTLTPDPDEPATFVGWSGGCSDTGPCIVTMYQDESRTATFFGQVATPSGSHPSGTYYDTFSLSIATSTSSATIRYTTDGSEPTETSPVYSSPISVNVTMTVKAKAFRQYWTPSLTATFLYLLQAADPTLTPPGGTYNSEQWVSFSTTTAGGTVRHTTDGSEPTAASPDGSVYIAETTTLNAKTFRAGWTPSNTVTASYTLRVMTPTISLASGTYDIGQTVTLSVSDGAASIRYTTDGTDPTEITGFPYTGPIVLNQPTNLRVRAFRQSFSPSDLVSAMYVLRLPALTLSPDGGAFSSTVVVTIGSSVSGVTIRCTFDGNEPTESSSTCTSSQSVPLESTLSVRSYKTGWGPSGVVVGAYVSVNPPPVSPGAVDPVGSASAGFVGTSGSATFSVSGAALTAIDNDVAAYRGQTLLPLTAGGTSFTVSGLVEGRNDLDISGVDTQDLPFSTRATIWAGSRTAFLSVINTTSQSVVGALVTGLLNDDEAHAVSGTTGGGGTVSLPNTPLDRRINLKVTASGYRTYEAYLPPYQSGGTIVLEYANNDFSAGLTGWTNFAGANAIIVNHSEASPPWSVCYPPQCAPRGPAEPLSSAGATPGTDSDLSVASHNAWGPQTVTRRFTIPPGVGKVNVRYRIGTAEFFYPQPEADWFRVKLRNVDTGDYVQESKTILQLVGQYDSLYWTGWKSLTLNTADAQFQTVELELTVSNVVDNAYDSYIHADFIAEQGIQATYELFDERNEKQSPVEYENLKYLSVSAHDAFPGSSLLGRTKVNGTITVTGPDTDSLSSLSLQVLEGGTVRLTVPVTSTAATLLLNRPFSQGVQIVTPQLLFSPLGSDLENVLDETTNGSLRLRIRGVTAQGHVIEKELLRDVEKLRLYPNLNRYGPQVNPRDNPDCNVPTNSYWQNFPCGLDGWALPSSVASAMGAPGVAFGDFSNMNAGHFPIHTFHRDALDTDVVWQDANGARWFNVTQASAQRLLALFSSPIGSQIDYVYVTLQPSPTNQFWNVVRNAMIGGVRLIPEDVMTNAEASTRAMPGRRIAREGRIRYAGGHLTHFHIHWKRP
jgi:hypothetical protein